MVKTRRLRVAAIGAALAVFSVTPVATQAPTAPPTQAPAAVPAGNAEKGKALYMKTGCYQCHGEQGQGGSQGPRVGPDPTPWRAFLAYLRVPRGEMPPYTEKVMTDQEVADVHAFLRTLPHPPPLGAIPLLQFSTAPPLR